MKTKHEEAMEMMSIVDPHGDFDGIVPITNESFDGSIHSVLEISTGKVFLSQGEAWSKELDGIVIAIDRNMNFEELKPSEYEVLEVLSWDEETDDLTVVPFKE